MCAFRGLCLNMEGHSCGKTSANYFSAAVHFIEMNCWVPVTW